MSDLIDRQDAIDALGEKPLVWDDFSDFDLGKAAQWSDDVDTIKELPSAQPKWIPVTEQLPEEDKEVLVSVYFAGLKQTHKNGWKDDFEPSYYVDIARYFCGEWSCATDEYKIASNRHTVLAWMPLPEPYKGEHG